MGLEIEDHETRRASRTSSRLLRWLPGLLVLSLACASQQTVVVWEKPGATPEELEAAREACLAEVEALRAAPGVDRQRIAADATGACFVACMKRHGFTWRTEKVSTKKAGESEREGAPDQRPYDEPLPASPECSVPPGGGPDGGPGGAEGFDGS